MVAAGIQPGTEQPTPGLELLEAMRAQLAPYDPTPAAGVRRDETTVPGLPGAPDVAVRIHRRASRAPAEAPGIVWFHPGGLILGTYDMDAVFLDRLVARTGCVAVTPDYRLA